MIEIPVNVRHTATVSGQSVVQVTCESCHREFVYILKREATGSVSSPFDILPKRLAQARAIERAQRRLEAALQTPDLVACPECGWFQQDMIRHANRQHLKLFLKLGVLVCVLGGIASIRLKDPLAFGLSLGLTAFGMIVIAAWQRMRDSNSQPGTVSAKPRAVASEGFPLAQYRELLADQQRRQDDSTQAASGGVDFAFDNIGQLPQAADVALDFVADVAAPPQQRPKAHRPAGAPFLLLAAIGGAAALSAVLDASFFEVPRGQLVDRIAGSLIVGPLVGFLIYWVVIAAAASRGARTAFHDDWRENRPLLFSPWRPAWNLGVFSALVTASAFAAGLRAPTKRGLMLVIGCQAVLLVCIWLGNRVRDSAA